MGLFQRFACVRQTDATDCGAACLATILLHHDRTTSLGRVREAVRTDLMGTTAMGLVEGAERFGLRARGVRADLNALPTLPLPAIAHVEEPGRRHFVVVHRVGRNGVVVADPAAGVRRMPLSEFAAWWTGVLVLLSPDAPFTAEPERSPARRLLSLLSGHRRSLVDATAAALVLAVLGFASAVYVQMLIDSALMTRSARTLHLLGAAMLLVIAARAVLGILRSYFLLVVGQRIYAQVHASYYRHLLRLPMSFFDTRRVGELASRLNDAGRVNSLLTGTTAALVVDLLMVVATVSAMLVYDPLLTAVALAAVPPFALAGVVLAIGFRRAQQRSMEANAELNAVLVESISGAEEIKMLAGERRTTARLDQGLLSVLATAWKTGTIGIRASVLSTVLTSASTLLVLWVGGYRAIQGEITVGELIAFSTLAGMMLVPIQRLIEGMHEIQDGLVAANRLWEITDLSAEEAATWKLPSLQRCRGEVELVSVRFRYGSRDIVLEDVSLRAGAGEMVALVGESGSGKTTVARLIQGLYTPEAGQVRIDGCDVRGYSLASVRSQIGVVGQEPIMFRGTVAENIAFGTEGEPDTERLHAAAAQAGADEFIAGLPHGYGTELGEQGVRLSTGQRQRVALARALYRDTPILVLDEVTSAQDAHSEALIRDTLQRLRGKKTVLLIAHRLSTVTAADRIVVLRRGRVVEEGAHRDLLATRTSVYRELWNRQMEASDAPPAREPRPAATLP